MAGVLRKMIKKLLGLLSFLLFLPACRGNSNSDLARLQSEISAVDAEPGMITTISCPLTIAGEMEGETYECAVYTVPVNYVNPELGTINLTFVRMFAIDQATEAPIAYLAGGPGQSSIL
jgi:hypothetical protein